jgi:hypothetical protein
MTETIETVKSNIFHPSLKYLKPYHAIFKKASIMNITENIKLAISMTLLSFSGCPVQIKV